MASEDTRERAAQAKGIRASYDGQSGGKSCRSTLLRLIYQRLGFVGLGSDEQLEAIMARVLADPEPVAHPHSVEETGMCVECDAAWVLERAREEVAVVSPSPVDAKQRRIVAAAELLYDNRVGWDEGRAPTAGRAFWAALGMELGRDMAWLVETDPDPENAEAERQAALHLLDGVEGGAT